MTVIISRTCSILRTSRICSCDDFPQRSAVRPAREGLACLLCPQNSGSPRRSSATMQPNDQTSVSAHSRLCRTPSETESSGSNRTRAPAVLPSRTDGRCVVGRIEDELRRPVEARRYVRDVRLSLQAASRPQVATGSLHSATVVQYVASTLHRRELGQNLQTPSRGRYLPV